MLILLSYIIQIQLKMYNCIYNTYVIKYYKKHIQLLN